MAEIADILKKIVARRRARVEELLVSGPEIDKSNGQWPQPLADRDRFSQALESAPGRAVIAEVKMGSPRLGSLQDSVDPVTQACLYAENGAACLSVVVEPDFFFGSYGLLTRCRQVSGLPTLAKDFIVHPIQLEWARDAGADAVLLIAALHDAAELAALAAHARRLGLVPLVECHSHSDLRLLTGSDWELIGVNNRDLRTFDVSLDRSIALLPQMPAESLKIAESGIGSGDDIARLEQAGFRGFLVGEALLLASDPAAKLRELVGIPWVG
jgi:indole-3-glycerol phosphate synthase